MPHLLEMFPARSVHLLHVYRAARRRS
jgi:hypothetical protein